MNHSDFTQYAMQRIIMPHRNGDISIVEPMPYGKRKITETWRPGDSGEWERILDTADIKALMMEQTKLERQHKSWDYITCASNGCPTCGRVVEIEAILTREYLAQEERLNDLQRITLNKLHVGKGNHIAIDRLSGNAVAHMVGSFGWSWAIDTDGKPLRLTDGVLGIGNSLNIQ